METDSPYLAPVPRRGRPNRPANVAHTLRFIAALRGVDRGGARRPHHPQRRPRLRLVSRRARGGRVGVMRLLAAHGLRPDTDLGQHFLLDENLVDLAVREAGRRARATWCWRSAPASGC